MPILGALRRKLLAGLIWLRSGAGVMGNTKAALGAGMNIQNRWRDPPSVEQIMRNCEYNGHMPTVVVEGITTFYEQSGVGPDLVLIHGLTYDHTCWSSQSAALSRLCRVTAYDLPGHGQSSAPTNPFTFDFYIQHLSSLMSALGIQNPFLAGHSMGGAVVLQYAGAFIPLQSKVLLLWTVNCRIHRRESQPGHWRWG